MCARQWALPTLDHGARSSPTPSHSGSQGPTAWVMRSCARLAPGSEVLDLACGSGRHSRVLAALGCRVDAVDVDAADRKSTRLNSSHSSISYAVFCLKKK